MKESATPGPRASAMGDPEGLEPASSIVMPGQAEPTIYDVARVAGVAPSTVSRALSKPGRVSYKTAERIRRAAEQLGYVRAGWSAPCRSAARECLAFSWPISRIPFLRDDPWS